MHHNLSSIEPVDAAMAWLSAFERAAATYNAEAVAGLFADDSHWRDLVAFTWHIRTFSSRDAIKQAFARAMTATKPRNFCIPDGRTPPRVVTRAGTKCIEAIFTFETECGRGSGILRLIPSQADGAQLACWVLLTTLDEIKGHEEQIGARRPRGARRPCGAGAS